MYFGLYVVIFCYFSLLILLMVTLYTFLTIVFLDFVPPCLLFMLYFLIFVIFVTKRRSNSEHVENLIYCSILYYFCHIILFMSVI